MSTNIQSTKPERISMNHDEKANFQFLCSVSQSADNTNDEPCGLTECEAAVPSLPADQATHDSPNSKPWPMFPPHEVGPCTSRRKYWHTLCPMTGENTCASKRALGNRVPVPQPEWYSIPFLRDCRDQVVMLPAMPRRLRFEETCHPLRFLQAPDTLF